MIPSVLKGIWLGFSIAAPVGPIGILVLTQSLEWGFSAGIANGFGAALADLIYGLIAVAGVRLIPQHSRAVPLIGGILLLALAWRSWFRTPGAKAPRQRNHLTGTAATFLLTLSNPMTILSFAAMVASAGTDSPVYFVTGIFLGSMLWWIILSLAAGWAGRRIVTSGTVLSRFSAVTLAAFGLWAVIHMYLSY